MPFIVFNAVGVALLVLSVYLFRGAIVASRDKYSTFVAAVSALLLGATLLSAGHHA
ncbi:hypothetical protein [Variovorax sp. W6]|uniref:hypothetical protein n=1 Tax=Variovorax sp. W6 TaxID=3093895 RepID=UPI003D801D08